MQKPPPQVPEVYISKKCDKSKDMSAVVALDIATDMIYKIVVQNIDSVIDMKVVAFKAIPRGEWRRETFTLDETYWRNYVIQVTVVITTLFFTRRLLVLTLFRRLRIALSIIHVMHEITVWNEKHGLERLARSFWLAYSP